MNRKTTITIAAAIVVLAGVAVGVVGAASRWRESDAAPCGPDFTRLGSRCCPTPLPGPLPNTCAIVSTAAAKASGAPALSCPSPLVVGPRGCDASDDIGKQRVHVAETTLTIGPSDWEAEGRVAARSIKTSAFFIDRFEVTVGRFCEAAIPQPLVAGSALSSPPRWRFCEKSDSARAAFGIPLQSAREYCARRGGRLPTEDEWLVAAAGDGSRRGDENEKGPPPRRYPWGDTGAVCRRAAFGLFSGPCAQGADGPDTVGAHPDGATPLGIHDLAGNVAEWVETGACKGAGEQHQGDTSPLLLLDKRRDAAAEPPAPVDDPSALSPPMSPSSSCIAIVRGGSWRTSLATELRTWLRREVPSEEPDPTIGFRCAYGGS